MRKLLSLLSLLLLVLSCRKATDQNADNVLHIPLAREISTLDPANSYDTVSASVVYQVYEQLYEYHYLKRPYTLQPLLAEDMPKVSKDGKRYTIKIKKNIRYHDHPVFEGKPRFVKAQDFITQIKRLAFLDTKSNGWWLFDEKIVGLNDFRKKAKSDLKKFSELNVSGLFAPDDHTLVIDLVEPYPQMLYALAMSFTSPLPKEVVLATDNKLGPVMIGTGPYVLKDWVPLSSLKLEKFSDYHHATYPGQGDRVANRRKLLTDSGKKLPFIEKIHFHIIREAQTRWLNFRNRKLDFLLLPKDNYASAIDPHGSLTEEMNKDNIKLHILPTLTYWWLSFNMKDPLLGQNLNLRKAIAHAINVDEYIKVFTNNIGQKANSIYPPGIPGYNPSSKLPYSYDLAKAKKFLKLAGYPEGKGLPEIRYDVRGPTTTNRQQAEFIQRELAKIGVKIKVVTNTFPAFLQKSRNGDLQFWQDGWAMDYPDAENSLQLLHSDNHAPGPNSTFYANSEFDKLFERLKLLSDGDEKRRLMIEMEAMVHKDLPWVMQYYARNYILYHDRLGNYRHSDLIYNYMKYLKLR